MGRIWSDQRRYETWLLVEAAAADAPNIYILPSSDSTNTFSLVPYLRAGLVWLSSAGVDLVVRGDRKSTRLNSSHRT